jgi:hypothetical protein
MDPHGPAGPSSFWKIADRTSSNEQKSLVTDLLERLHSHVLHMDDSNDEGDLINSGDDFEDADDDDDEYEEDEMDDDDPEARWFDLTQNE